MGTRKLVYVGHFRGSAVGNVDIPTPSLWSSSRAAVYPRDR